MTTQWPEVEEALEPIVRALASRDRIAVVGHVDPDLDSIGSILALQRALAAMGKSAWAVTPDPDPRPWHFLPGHRGLLVGDPPSLFPDVAVVLDTEVSPDRVGASWGVVQRASLKVNVDHHETNNRRAHLWVVEPRAAATGELVFYLVRALGVAIDRELATLLYVALMTDTGSFQFPNTAARTLAIASFLVEAGAPPAELAMAVFDNRSWEYVRLVGRLLDQLERTPDGKIAWARVVLDEVEDAGVSASEAEGLVRYPRMIEGVEVAILFKGLTSGRTRVSLRSKRYVDVSAIARRFGGGGHLRAAGCTVDGPLPEAVRRVVAACQEAVELAPEHEPSGASEVTEPSAANR